MKFATSASFLLSAATAQIGKMMGSDGFDTAALQQFNDLPDWMKAPTVERFCDDYLSTVQGDFEMGHADALDVRFAEGVSERILENMRLEPENVVNLMAARIDANPLDGMKSAFCDGGVCEAPLGLSGIWGYGCWCNFGAALMTGRAAPVNKFDEICRDMQLCLRCAVRDSENGGYDCEPKTNSYNTVMSFLPTSEALDVQCSLANPDDDCGAHVCTCEMDLVNELLNLLWDSVPYTDEYLHSNGWVPSTENCPPSAGSGKDIECCGYYPDRFPFGGVRECCDADQTIYNPSVQDCCEYGVDGLGNCV